MLELRQDLHLSCHILEGTPFRAFIFMYVLHGVHVAATVTFLHDADLLAQKLQPRNLISPQGGFALRVRPRASFLE